jgi:8-oxo-dGTP diphosphatase
MMTQDDTSEDIFHLGIKALIRNDQGKILLLQVNPAKLKADRGKYWDLPGGRVQEEQSISDTLKREVAEEIGVTDVRIVKEVGMVLSNIRIPLSEHKTVGLILAVYECLLPSSTAIVLSDEHIAYEWFTTRAAAEVLAVKYPKHFCELVANL